MERVMTTTLNKIRSHGPCKPGWDRLLAGLGKTEADDEPLSFIRILEINGIEDAVWSLRACDDERAVRLYACDCAEHVLAHFESLFPGDDRPRRAIEVARAYANGRATEDELRSALAAAWAAAWAAEFAAWDAAWDAAWAAARDAAWAAEFAAWAAAGDAACVAEREWQVQKFREYFGEEEK